MFSDGELSEPYTFGGNEPFDVSLISENERKCALRAISDNCRHGAAKNNFDSIKCLYLPIRVNDSKYGVVGIGTYRGELDSFEKSVMLSIIGECALALENEKNAREKEEAAILAKNEQLRANLLRAISHDLRTPLTSISGNADNLLSNSAAFDEDAKNRIYEDIYNDSIWLINLVENLLSVTRIEDEQMRLNFSTELIDDVIAEALNHVSRKRDEHKISVDCGNSFIFVTADIRLLVQVIINLVDNAIKHTASGTKIEIKAESKDNNVVLTVKDNGCGISGEAKEHIFDMFYSGANRIADSRRSLGLGLALCRSVINAHGGSISVSDNEPAGTVFTVVLPQK